MYNVKRKAIGRKGLYLPSPKRGRIARGHAVTCAQRVTFISLAMLLWEIIAKTEGLGAIIAAGRQFGFGRAQEIVYQLLSDEDFMPLPQVLEAGMYSLDPAKDIGFWYLKPEERIKHEIHL